MKHVHLVGIGGSGLSGIARIMRSRGIAVSGSDSEDSPDLIALRGLGVEVQVGHSTDLVHALAREIPDECEALVVRSVAVPESNPELVFAREQGWPVLTYPELLGRWSRERFTIAVAGTHGKTTTCGMIVMLLRAAGLDPGFVIGGRIRGLPEGNAHWGHPGHPLVVEACEYANSFLNLDPDVAVVTNVEADHLDFHGDFAGVCRSFRRFLRLDGESARSGEGSARRVVSSQVASVLGMDAARARWLTAIAGEENGCAAQLSAAAAEYRLALAELGGRQRGCYSFRPELGGQRFSDVALQVPGKHNVANAMTALAAVTSSFSQAGVELERSRAGFDSFRGAERRFQVLCESDDHVVIDDYAHHPTEIEATLEAARGRYPGWHIVAIYQPHQASRTRDHLERFGRVLAQADHCLLTQIYFARDCEEDRRCMSSMVVSLAIEANGGRSDFTPDFDSAVARALQLYRHQTVYLVMGAGDVFRVAERLVQRL